MDWIFTIGAGAAGYLFLNTLIAGLVTKIFPTPGATLQKVLAAVVPAVAVIGGLWLGKHFFGREMKEV